MYFYIFICELSERRANCAFAGYPHNLPPTHYLAWSWSVRRNKKYFLQFGYKYPLQVTEIYFAIQTNTFAILTNMLVAQLTNPHYLAWSWSVRQNKIYFPVAIWKNLLCNSDKYFCKFDKYVSCIISPGHDLSDRTRNIFSNLYLQA